MHQQDLADGDHSGRSTAEYASTLRAHCAFDAPFRVGSCDNVVSCNFDGRRIYMSSLKSYTPSNICSPAPSVETEEQQLERDLEKWRGIALFGLVVFLLALLFLPCLVFGCGAPPGCDASVTTVSLAVRSAAVHLGVSRRPHCLLTTTAVQMCCSARGLHQCPQAAGWRDTH
jgi:hypothetical protein